MPGKILQITSGPAAYRADVNRESRPLRQGSHDGDWIAVTTLLEQAALVPGAARLIERAIEIACDCLGAGEIRRRSDREWRDNRAPAEAILILSDDAFDADAFNSAIAMLVALDRADPGLNPVLRGRLLARRARAVSRLGRLEEACDGFRAVERLGIEAASAELRARAWTGLGSVAQMAGDYDTLHKFTRRALRLAKREGLRSIERRARLGLTIAAGARHDFDAALVHGWAVYLASVGEATEEGEILQTFGQLLVEAKCYGEARAAFSAVVARALPARVILPALGGLALAAGETQRVATVRWVANQLNVLSAAGVSRYQLALALTDCSAALARVGAFSASAEMEAKAVSIAREHGFHEVTKRELAKRTEELSGRETVGYPAPFALRGRAVRIAGRIALMEPGQLPDEVSLVAVPA